jgi:CHAT domain-containing protein/tetratricopeptide (TPR) repeat protein
MLTGEDAKKAAELQKRIADLEAADKYAEAIGLQEELLALRTKVQGADHWETVDEKWVLAVLNKVAALPEQKRASWRRAKQGFEEAGQLEQRAQYGKALPLRLEWLKLCQQVLGEDCSLTAANYKYIALNLTQQGKYPEAGPLHQKALEIFRMVLGEDHPNTAIGYSNVAFNMMQKAEYAEAEPFLQRALYICRKVLGEAHQITGTSYNNLGMTRNAQAKYDEAGPLLQRALEIRRKVLGEEHADTAQSYNNVGFNLSAQGKYAEAEPLYQKALEINRKVLGEEHPATAVGYNNVAAIWRAQGKYAEVGPLQYKALAILRNVHGEEHPATAIGYNNAAFNLTDQGKYAEAEPLHRKALKIWRKVHGDEHPDTARGYNNVAFNLNAQGKYAAAGPLYLKALEISSKVQGLGHPDTATGYYNVALNLSAQGKYSEALPLLREALDISHKANGEVHPDTFSTYYVIAQHLHAQGKSAVALEFLEPIARCYEAARQGVAARGLERAFFGAKYSPYNLLAAVQSRVGRWTSAWVALESNLAPGLLDEMASRRGSGLTQPERHRRDELRRRITPINGRILALVGRGERTDAEAKELDKLIDERKGLEKSLIEMAVEASRREVATLAEVQAALLADAAFVAWVDVSDKWGGVQDHWGCVVRPSEDPNWERLHGTDEDDQWTKEDTELPARFREALVKAASISEIDALGQKLHAQRLAPLSKHLTGVKRLYVAPVHAMAGIPIEALTDHYTVSYAPSGTFLARLKDREWQRNASFLAVGDPVFPPVKEAPRPTALPPGGLLIAQVVPNSNAAKARLQGGDVLVAYAGKALTSVDQLGKLIEAQAGAKSVVVKVWREGQERMAEREVAPGRLGVALTKEPAREAITARRQTDEMLAKLTRGEAFAELPGTQIEIARLAGLIDAKNVTTLTRAGACEEQLDEMRKADKLKQFKYLHFATHAKANNFRSFDSALILTPPEKVPEPRAGEPWLDGRLTAAEVLEYWKLDAELVTLSACESALGRQGGGDGLLGFAQAFLLAGSRSVCLTLWQVDDTATALLMDRFYRNLLGKREDGAKPMGKAIALHEAKQWLRNLSAKDALEGLGTLTMGVVRGERPAREVMKTVPVPKAAAKDFKPYAHPRYWAAFILVGDPE